MITTPAELAKQRPLTRRERLCLGFLADKMWARAGDAGKAIIAGMGGKGGSNYVAVGSNVLGALRHRNPSLAARLPDIELWRITPAGRNALAEVGP